MPHSLPPSLLLLQEQAASVRRCAEILHTAAFDSDTPDEWNQLRKLVSPRSRVHPEEIVPFVEEALRRVSRWAQSNPPPTIAILRQARNALEAIAKDWTLAKEQIEQIDIDEEVAIPLGELFYGTRLFPKLNETLQALLVSWPVENEDEEGQRLQEMKAGQSVDLDEAFAEIAGLSKEAWQQRVADHNKS